MAGTGMAGYISHCDKTSAQRTDSKGVEEWPLRKRVRNLLIGKDLKMLSEKRKVRRANAVIGERAFPSGRNLAEKTEEGQPRMGLANT